MRHRFFHRYILHGKFDHSLIRVDFRAISKSFLSFISQKTYSGKFSRQEVNLSRRYLRKCSIWLPPSPSPPCIFNLSFFQNGTKSDPVRCFHDFLIPMIPTTGKNFRKIHEVRVICLG